MKKIRALIYTKYGLIDIFEITYFGFASQHLANMSIDSSIACCLRRYKGEITEVNIKVEKVNRQLNSLYID